MTRVFGSRRQPGAFFFFEHKALNKTRRAKTLWKRPQLWKSIKVAFGNFFLMIPTSCLEKPSPKPLRLYHRYHSADRNYAFRRRHQLISLQTQNSSYSQRAGFRGIAGVAAGERLHRDSDGKHRIVLETGVQHFRRAVEGHLGESGAGESASGEKDRS